MTSCLVDTNILLRLAETNSPMNAIARRSVVTLKQQGLELHIAPQNIIEFWVVATRPISSNGLGLTVEDAIRETQRLKVLFTLLDDRLELFSTWENLVQKYQVLGKQAHDARLVAAMAIHEISHILTFNIQDFQRFVEIIVIDPNAV